MRDHTKLPPLTEAEKRLVLEGQAPTPKAILSKATGLLFQIAARSHTLREVFGVERTDHTDDDDGLITFLHVHRPWLTPHPKDSNYLTFDPDTFARQLNACSDGEHHMLLFILNVWNPGYAKSKGWHFNLFQALGTLDEGNRNAICWWTKRPIWP